MKKILLIAISIVCLMASCTNDSTSEMQTNPMAGKEVVFVPGNDLGLNTRTIYGEETTDGDSIRVNWVDGDKVLVYGSTCAVKQAEYAVSAGTVNQNYADALTKTGDAGVQWGESTTSNFLAIYPSSAATITSDTKATATIRSTQNNVFEPVYAVDETGENVVDDDGNLVIAGWKGHPFAADATDKTMVDGIMFARTEDATATDKQVNLRFKPFTTVLKFKFTGFYSQNSDPTIYVQSITVTSPDGSPIAGEFNLEVSDSGADAEATKVEAGTTTSNTITLNTILAGGSYIPLTEKIPIEFDVFTLPLSNQTITADWSVKITTNYGEFTYSLTPNANANTNLVAGKVHHITIPTLEVLGTASWDPTKWMTQVVQTAYLSELSIPGTWYSQHESYQNTTDLTTQYNAGIRAFNIDCRVSKTEQWNIAGSGEYSDGDTDVYLAVAGTEELSGVAGRGKIKEGLYVVNQLQTLAGLVSANPDEYIVVVITIAEKPFEDSDEIFGTVKPKYVLPLIVEALKDTTVASALYSDKITSNTTVEDVLGKMIVKINTNNSDIEGYTTDATTGNTIYNYTYPTNSLVSFASMAMSGWISDDITNVLDTSVYTDYYLKMQTVPMYWGNTETDLTYYYHQAQRTTTDDVTVSGVPTLAQREAAIDNIINLSTTIYDNSDHNGWFQLGIGGYTKDSETAANSQSAVAERLNEYLRTKIESKMDTDPSPVGIVLMNHATTTDTNDNVVGIQLVQDIIEMNGKFYLKRAGGDIITGDGTGDSSGETSGDNTNTDADMGDDQP